MFILIIIWDQVFEFSLHVRSVYVKNQMIKMFTYGEETMLGVFIEPNTVLCDKSLDTV